MPKHYNIYILHNRLDAGLIPRPKFALRRASAMAYVCMNIVRRPRIWTTHSEYAAAASARTQNGTQTTHPKFPLSEHWDFVK